MGLFERLNMTSQERRIVAVVVVVLFAVLNYWFVWPHFKDLKIAQKKLAENREKLALYQTEVARIQPLEAELKKLQESSGARELPAEAFTDFKRVVEGLVQSCRVDVTYWSPVNTANTGNNFFMEGNLAIRATVGEKEFVDFLYRLGTNSSMIRVRDLSLAPTGPGTN